MRKPSILLIVCHSIVISLLISCSLAQKSPKEVQKWFKAFPNAKEKVTQLHFYFHDVVSGNKTTSVAVAEANSTFNSPALFGLISIIDSPLTVGLRPSSKIMGRAQGITGCTSSLEMTLLMTLNFVFTDGEYNGSTLSVVGYNPIYQKYRELAIVGGSGVFRLARGIATAETVRFNRKTGNAIVEYNVMVIHY